MTLNGDATTFTNEETYLSLTVPALGQIGSAWYTTLVPVANGFTTTFQFEQWNSNTLDTLGPADGIAFVIQGSGTTALGDGGGAIGYGGNPFGFSDSLAVEFDTYENPWDLDNNHVAVQSCGTGANTEEHNVSCADTQSETAGCVISFTDGSTPSCLGYQNLLYLQPQIPLYGYSHTAIITYTPPQGDATYGTLQVTVDGETALSVPVNLATLLNLGTNGTAYVGFTGATGAGDEEADIFSWSFTGTPIMLAPITPTTLSQSFVFNCVGTPPTCSNYVAFNFDFTTAYNNNDDLTIPPNSTPYLSDTGITEATWQQLVQGTSLATTSCVQAAGQTDPSGATLCPFITMTCTTSSGSPGTTSTPPGTGAGCPTSSARNLLFNHLLDISTQYNDAVLPNSGRNVPGVAMGPDVWNGPYCTYPADEPLYTQLCPESILTAIENDTIDFDNGPKTGETVGGSNSTLVLFCCELEWTTTVTFSPPGPWFNSSTIYFTLTATPPATPTAPNNGWVAALNQNIIWGDVGYPTALPDPTFPNPGETTVLNPTACPSSWTQTPPPVATAFTTPPQSLSVPSGAYQLYYFSTDCTDFEELAFPANISGSTTPANTNLASFYSTSFFVDTDPPMITSSPSSPTATYGTAVTATITCTDPIANGVASGITSCAGQTASPQSCYPAFEQFTGWMTTSCSTAPSDTVMNVALDSASTPVGSSTAPVSATDGAGNTTTFPIPYSVTPAPLTITASSASMNWGGTVPTITPMYSGLVLGQTGLTPAPSCSTTATSTSPPGNYPSMCTVSSSNYSISEVPGVVTVLGTLGTSPNPVNFGTLYFDTVGAQLLTLTNTGTTSITISSLTISSVGATAPLDYGSSTGTPYDISLCPPMIVKLPATLPAGESCEIGVGILASQKVFSPTASTATLDIGAEGTRFPVTLTAQVIEPLATLSASSISFGKVETTTGSSTKSVTLTNTGYTPLTIKSIVVSGTGFALETPVPNGACPATGGTLNASGSCTIYVTFAPKSKGSATGMVTISDNALSSSAACSPPVAFLDECTQVITLSGTGD